jgi:DNA polymerase III alpha subunit (gram-positive type)
MENKTYIFFDLETNGLDYYTTSIMQTTILDYNGEVLLNQYTYPFDNRIDGYDIHGIDKNKLIKNNAISTVDLCTLIKKIIRSNYGRGDIYFIAYNNFGYDQIILENNFKICNVKIPDNWYFIDLFPIVKELYRNIKPNYKLKSVYEYFMGKDEIINFHCSLADTQCLYKIFIKLEYEIKEKCILSKYTRPLLNNPKIFIAPVSTLSGYTDSMLLNAKNIYNISDLYNVFANLNYCITDFENYMETKLNIYNTYYRKNMIKQIEAIYKFNLNTSLTYNIIYEKIY